MPPACIDICSPVQGLAAAHRCVRSVHKRQRRPVPGPPCLITSWPCPFSKVRPRLERHIAVYSYHPQFETASSPSGPLASSQLGPQVLERACGQVRSAPSRLPLWSLRIAQHVRLGALGYRESWSALYRAARDGGASESTVRRTLYNSFASAQVVRDPPPRLVDLATRGLS